MASENSDKMTSELYTTRRILLRVAYDGTNYHGWQVQPNAKTIEGELNRVLTQLTGEEIQVTGASRTDAGVHALGNVAVFDTVSKIPAEKFSYALNQRLPEDIVRFHCLPTGIRHIFYMGIWIWMPCERRVRHFWESMILLPFVRRGHRCRLRYGQSTVWKCWSSRWRSPEEEVSRRPR